MNSLMRGPLSWSWLKSLMFPFTYCVQKSMSLK